MVRCYDVVSQFKCSCISAVGNIDDEEFELDKENVETSSSHQDLDVGEKCVKFDVDSYHPRYRNGEIHTSSRHTGNLLKCV